MVEKNKHWSLSKWKNATATDLQKAIRAEAGAKIGMVRCVLNGEIRQLCSPLGKVVCVTCGKIVSWKGRFIKDESGAHAGHFLQSRRPSILFEESGIHCQCSHCNLNDGNPIAYHQYMMARYGIDEIVRLQRMKHDKTISFTREDYEEMRESYRIRWKAACKIMGES